ncbi:hypothetical protein V5N11_031314 [Cardamine amara subsp. amara]|uniref:Transmembrane protein n=1 Tax=Cardamine amara subsp. amara TaxID=228776 RepID=A0ABD1C4N7_CARAN
MADQAKHGQVFHLLCIFSVAFFLLFVLSVNVSAEDKTTTVWLSKIKHSGQNYWAKLREALDRGHSSHFFPPNIEGKEGSPMGAGENMKEAVTKSFEKSKETVEEAARSAAEVVSDTVDSVKQKVKRSVSGGGTQQSEVLVTEIDIFDDVRYLWLVKGLRLEAGWLVLFLSLSLSLSKSRFAASSSLLPSSNLVSFRSQSSDRRGDLYEIDTASSQSPSDPLIQKLEDAVHRIFVRRSAPDWLPFVPGASYWVPPPGSGSQSHGIAQLVAKLANPLTDEESLSTNSSHGWPSSDYFLKGVQPQLMETKTDTAANSESHSEDEEV